MTCDIKGYVGTDLGKAGF